MEVGRGVRSLIWKCSVGGSYIFECNINKTRLRIILFSTLFTSDNVKVLL